MNIAKQTAHDCQLQLGLSRVFITFPSSLHWQTHRNTPMCTTAHHPYTYEQFLFCLQQNGKANTKCNFYRIEFGLSMPRTKLQDALLSISTVGVSFYDMFQVRKKSPNCPTSAWLTFVFCSRVYTAEVRMKMG
jgi:hypothetical protein